MKKYLLLAIIGTLLNITEVFPQHSGPFNLSACVGDTGLFKVDHSFDYVTFQWEESTDNVNFSSINASGAYSGIQTDALTVYTGQLNPFASGIWRYYRCYMYSNIYGWGYSASAYLEINIPPTVDFNWTNPCQGQTNHFESIVGTGAAPFKYNWTFGDPESSVSVYPDPSFLYSNAGIYTVTLTVTDNNGCKNSISKQVEIFSIPEMTISGKEVVCSNELGVKYNVDLEGENVHYTWDISGLGTIDNDTAREINIGWNPVNSPVQTKIMLTVTIDPSGCSTQVTKDVLITSYVAPDTGLVFRKPYESTVLIYKGPEVNSYKWGSTDNLGVDHYMPKETGERFYCDFQGLDGTWDYWVETSFDSRINCVTRSYYNWGSNKLDIADNTAAFTIYPVPASNQVNVRLDKSMNLSGIAVFNMMMQKVYKDESPVAAQNEYAISLENFISGIYIIQVTDDSGISNFRVFTIEK
jgi:PKD repeat protein